MKRNALALTLATLAFTIGAPLAHANGGDLVCYRTDTWPDFRLRLNVKFHSPLTEGEDGVFGHAKQFVFSAHGKENNGCYLGSVGAATGTVIVGVPQGNTNGPVGAHMGVQDNLVRGTNCAPAVYDCTSAEITPTPNRWFCQVRNDFGLNFTGVVLQRVDPLADPYCGIFEDGGAAANIVPEKPGVNTRDDVKPKK